MLEACFDYIALTRFAAGVYPLILQGDLYRYLIGAGGMFLVVNTLLAGWLARRKIREEKPSRRQMMREILASLRTVLIFSLIGLVIAIAAKLGLLTVYEDPAERGWPYFMLNVLVLIVAHDAWFYWTHRIMHRPRPFRWFHTLHHRSYNPSPGRPTPSTPVKRWSMRFTCRLQWSSCRRASSRHSFSRVT